MAIVSVTQLKPGDMLNDNVMTKAGNLLMEKGKSITERDKVILSAFLIPKVSIESKNADPNKEEQDESGIEEIQTAMPFYEEYHKMLQLLKKVFNWARSGTPLPILDIRTQLELLIKQIAHYNILTISARNNDVMEYLLHNSITVSLTSYQLAKWHGFQQKDLVPIALAGLLHDIGNARVDEALLEKKSQLMSAELEEMRKHTVIGYNILKPVPAINEGVKFAALQHHEREDGSGYPLAVKGDKIHPYAKVVAIADIFHAMTSNRHHKKAQSPYLVLEELQKESFGKLEPMMVQTLINRVTSFSNGMVVKLSDDRVGEIVFSDRSNPTRPWVNVKGTIVNLTVDRHLFIQEVVSFGN
jgi:HD-GYP domain-containing protein (c-di-GMP phosphodiesterase class II)